MSLSTVVPALAVDHLLAEQSSANNAQQRLQQLFADEWDLRISQSPSLARQFNKPTPGGFADISIPAQKRRAKQLKLFLAELKSVPYIKLSNEDQINYQLFEYQLKARLNNLKYETYLFPMEGDTGFYFELLRLADTNVIRGQDDAQYYLETLQAIPEYLSQWRGNMELGISKGKVMPAIVLVDFEKPLDALITATAEENPLFKPLQNVEQVLPDDKAAELKRTAINLIQEDIQPAVNEMRNYLANIYIPAGRASIAATQLPEGKAYYQSQIDFYTSLNLSANQIHQMGLQQVKRIRQEMEQVIQDSGFKGNFAEFVQYLRTDPKFYATSAEELLKEAAYIAKKMDGALPRFFTRLPRQPYGVEPVPASIAPRYTTGRYIGAPLDSQRSGSYWVNTHALDKRPLYVLEALTLHEAVPGHHLQTALTQELADLPNFRRYSYLSVYGEGWALYCEKLGVEAGFYQTPYTQFGRLTYEMWRAIRLVVDTGMHAKGWSRERAIQFMNDNTALSKHNVRTEIDRYIAWPGQALSYKVGEIKILELRQLAEQTLGKQFDIRLFHDEILRNGPVTLTILEQQIERWLKRQQSHLSTKVK